MKDSAHGSHRSSAQSVLGQRVDGATRRAAGFTLLELLVVVTIIGVLAALLSTAFNNTKNRSRKISCLSNMRQLQIAWICYVDDNEDFLPLNKSVAGPLNERVFGRRNSSNSWVVGNPKEDVTPLNIMRGSLFPYTRSVALYRCPADRSTVLGRTGLLRTRSFAMSAYMNGDDEGLDPRVKLKATEINNPSPDRVFVLIEEHQASSWAGSFRILPREGFSLTSATWASTPADRHNRGCNLSFVDGHVEYWRWSSSKNAEEAQSKLLSLTPAELRDLKRLQEAVPRP